MDVLLLAFVNQTSDLLPTLQEEDDALNRLLSPRAKEQHFLLHRESFMTLEKLPTYLTLYRNDLVLFLYSGHAGRDALLLGDGVAHVGGIAQMLGQCPNLRLVFLNGCSTQGQVSQLLAAGVPVILATSAPVSDRKATVFSTRFFEALQQQFTIREAFEMAKGALEMTFPEVQINRFRSAGFEVAETNEPLWGLFFSEKSEHLLDWKLPVQATLETASMPQFTPNQHLIEALFTALAAFNDDVHKLDQQVRRGVQIPAPKKRMALLNALPAPLAEPLRKLMVPVEKENEGFDKVSEARLRQIAQAYTTSMEMLCYTMLAELWDAFYEPHLVDITPAQREVLRAFFRLPRTDREEFDLLPLIGTLRAIFSQNNIDYFVKELRDIWRLTEDDPKFLESVHFLNGLRLQTRHSTMDKSEVGFLNKRGEECLAYLYSNLGFMARYKLATIQSIDVEKYRHRRDPRYNHATVMLHDLLGGFDVSEINLDKSLDNRSILLLNEDTWEYLNLTPFVVDENAFRERTDVCKLYFFSHYLKAADTYCFKYINKPDDPYLEISDARYPLVKEQFEAFADLILQQSMPSV
jgi:hypothetical protein